MLLDEKDNTQLELILQYGQKISGYIERFGVSEKLFISDCDYHDLCAFALVQIGEAVNRLSEDFVQHHDEVDWKGLYGMRCYLVHGYESVNYRTLWQAITEDLPGLMAFCQTQYEG